MRLMWCITGLLALVATIYGSDCPESVVLNVKNVLWARCNEENDRRLEELKRKTVYSSEQIRQACCILSDTSTCWVDSLRSLCGDEAANDLIKTVKFSDDCANWKYPESISRCQLWYTTWWFITIVAIIVIVIIAAVVFWGLRKRARSSR